MDCIFCKIVNHEIPAHIIYEDDKVVSFLDLHPNAVGHTLVIPKEHAPNFTSANVETVDTLVRAVHQIAPQVVKMLGADGYNIILNNGSAAGQVIEHIHWHIIPRRPNDGLVHWPRSLEAKEKLPETYEFLKGKIQ